MLLVGTGSQYFILSRKLIHVLSVKMTQRTTYLDCNLGLVEFSTVCLCARVKVGQ